MIVVDKISKIKDDKAIPEIVSKTANTWQKNRSFEEKRKDTKIGKLAENIVEHYVLNELADSIYIPYDSFRKNNYNKHAPFDGILVNKKTDKKLIQSFFDKINNEVSNNKYGKIPDKLKSELEENKLFTVEIKSTRVTARHKRNGNDIENIKNEILKDDFLEYPKYIRTDKYNSINNLDDYISFCKKYRDFRCEEDCEAKIRLVERNNMRYFYIRVYIDEASDRAYIVGYIDKYIFSSGFILKKMKQFNKSEYAVYLSYPLKGARHLSNINSNYQ